MEKIRMLHFADLHVGMENYGRLDPRTGVSGRVLDFLRRFDDLIDYGLEREVDLVIFSGDAFKTRDPNPTYQRAFARRVKRLADAGVPVVLLVGNHDIPAMAQKASSVDIFHTLAVPHVIVGRVEAVHRIETRRGPVQVVTFPYPVRGRLLSREEYRGLSMADLDKALRTVVTDLIEATRCKLDALQPASIDAVRNAGEPLVQMSDEVYAQHASLKKFLNRHLYMHEQKLEMTAKVQVIVRDLFTAYSDDVRRMPDEHADAAERLDDDGRARVIADYIAGMTDRYAIAAHEAIAA